MLTASHFGINEFSAGDGVMFELDSEMDTASILQAGGWTLLTGINLMLFSLLHNPCSTTIYTIYQETKSKKWTLIASIMPVIMGFVICFLVAQFYRIFESL
jgi:ferrous iron transport protein B